MNNKCVLTLTALICSSGTAMAGSPDEPPANPSVLLILADDVGCEPIGCYGGTSFETPRIDALARSGLRFRHAYSMPVCHPTRLSLLTGRYPFRLDNPAWGSFPEEEEERTLGHVLKRAGYATAIAGKWQLTLLAKDPEHPHRLGFDEYCLFGWHEGPRYYDPLLWQNGKVREDTRGRYGPDIYCDFLIDFMERQGDRPFFAFYSMALCHDVTDDLDEPVPFGPRGRYDSYGEMVEAMDARVGRLIDALERLGLRERTIVLFTGDNGTAKRSIITAKDGKLIREDVVCRVGDRNVPGGKGELTDAGTRVPLIASFPGVVPEGEVTDALVDSSDFLPTLADLSGARLPADVSIDGRSFAGTLRGERDGREWVFAERRGGQSWVRTRRFKLYRDGRLFDVENDPLETEPIDPQAASPETAAARQRLREVFAKELGLAD